MPNPPCNYIGFRPEVRRCTHRRAFAPIYGMCAQRRQRLLQLSSIHTTTAFETTANTKQHALAARFSAALPSFHILFHGLTRSKTAAQKLAWPLHESKRGNNSSFGFSILCAWSVFKLDTLCNAKIFLCTWIILPSKVPCHAEFQFN